MKGTALVLPFPLRCLVPLPQPPVWPPSSLGHPQPLVSPSGSCPAATSLSMGGDTTRHVVTSLSLSSTQAIAPALFPGLSPRSSAEKPRGPRVEQGAGATLRPHSTQPGRSSRTGLHLGCGAARLFFLLSHPGTLTQNRSEETARSGREVRGPGDCFRVAWPRGSQAGDPPLGLIPSLSCRLSAPRPQCRRSGPPTPTRL